MEWKDGGREKLKLENWRERNEGQTQKPTKWMTERERIRLRERDRQKE